MKTTDDKQPKQWTVIVPIAGHVVMTVTAKTERGAEKEALRQLNAGVEYEDLEWDFYERLVEGNCLNVSINEISATPSEG